MKKTIYLHAVDVTSNPTAAIVELKPQDDPYALSSCIKATYPITVELEQSGQLPSQAGFEAEAKFIKVLEPGASPSLTALHGQIHGGFYAVKMKWYNVLHPLVQNWQKKMLTLVGWVQATQN